MVAPRHRRPRSPSAVDAGAGQVRIVGGRWRGSKLPVAGVDGLRPTADRVRETLFNWLAPALIDSHCVDLFAGSGALGFEAASRGAACSVLVERDAALVASLRASVARLHADNVEVLHADAPQWLRGTADRAQGPFDIAFVDPPFRLQLWDATLDALAPRLADGALVYVECASKHRLQLPDGFELHREGATRDVEYRLFRMHRSTRSA